jgi:hypothetical protein
MNTSTAGVLFSVIYSVQWYYAVIRCEKEPLLKAANQTSSNSFNPCSKVYLQENFVDKTYSCRRKKTKNVSLLGTNTSALPLARALDVFYVIREDLST